MPISYNGNMLDDVDPNNPIDASPEANLPAWLRLLAAALKDWAQVEHFDGTGVQKKRYAVGTTDGNTVVASNYLIDTEREITALAQGEIIAFKIPEANLATTVWLDVDGLGQKRLKLMDGEDPAIGDLKLNKIYMAIYDGTNWLLQNTTPKTITNMIAADEIDFPDGYTGDIDVYLPDTVVVSSGSGVQIDKVTITMNGGIVTDISSPETVTLMDLTAVTVHQVRLNGATKRLEYREAQVYVPLAEAWGSWQDLLVMIEQDLVVDVNYNTGTRELKQTKQPGWVPNLGASNETVVETAEDLP